MTKLILNEWLRKNGVHTYEASDWNELTLNLQEFFKGATFAQNSPTQYLEAQESNVESSIKSVFIIIIDIGLLDLSTELWKQQLNFLDEYCTGRASFVWILNHDTSNAIKAELRKRGHLLMVNKPLYKAKMIQILETVIRDTSLQAPLADAQFHELLEIDDLHSTSADSDDSQKSENEQKSLEGLRILLAEDTPVLQRVATIMLEKMGAKVVVVGDGIQTVDALKDKTPLNGYGNEDGRSKATHVEALPFDLILMDCQVSFFLKS